MHGVSEVIAIILILMITISLAGLAYMFMSTTMNDVTASAGSTVDTTTSSMMTSFTIESISQGRVYVRNTGQNALTGLSVYVGDVAVSASTPVSISPSELGVINITSVIFKDDQVRVTSQNGVSASKSAPAEYYGAIGYWKFDEGSGSVVYDSSGVGNNGNFVSGNASWTSGLFNSAVKFNSSYNGFVSIPKTESITTFDAFTISAWFYPFNVTQTATGIVGWSGNCPSSCYNYTDITISSNLRIRFEISTTSWNNCSFTPFETANLNSWNFVAFTYNGNDTAGYLNGVKVWSSSCYNRIYPHSSVYLGYWGQTAILNGTIDEVAIWNRSLTSLEVMKLYNKAN